jgi:RimJ/RimL family protein N-acetyltransferase
VRLWERFDNRLQRTDRCPASHRPSRWATHIAFNPVLDLSIRSPRLRLRHFSLEDAAAIHQLNAEPSTSHWLPSHVYADAAEAREALAYLIASYSEPGDPRRGPYVLAVEHADTRKLLGHVGFSPLDDQVEVSYAIAEVERGHGYGAEALAHACERIALAFGLPSVVAATATENIASRRLLERAGFFHERDEHTRFQGIQRVVSRYTWRANSGGNTGS